MPVRQHTIHPVPGRHQQTLSAVRTNNGGPDATLRDDEEFECLFMGRGLRQILTGAASNSHAIYQYVSKFLQTHPESPPGRIHLHLGRRTNRPGFRSIAASEVRRRAG